MTRGPMDDTAPRRPGYSFEGPPLRRIAIDRASGRRFVVLTPELASWMLNHPGARRRPA